jgi:signal transduction histidine kinase
VEQSRKTILYIEDDPASRVLVERTLRYAGYRVVVAERGLEGLDLARREEPDLILMDINLPDLSGRETTTMLRSEPRFQFTPIVALTAQAMRNYHELAMAAGMNGYLVKPLDVEELPKQVEYYLNGGQDKVEPNVLTEAQARYTQEVVVRLEARVRQLEHYNDLLYRLDKMKESFIQLTAHELRTPLTLVHGYQRLLEDSPQLKQLIQQDTNTRLLMEGLTASIDRMQTTVNEILSVSRVMTEQIDLSVGPLDLGHVALKVLKSFALALQERSLNVFFQRAEWPERVYGDWELLELALSSLVSNAIKYTPDGGQITLRAKFDNETVRISVKDSGIGIDPLEHNAIFERFHTAGNPQLHSTSKTTYLGGGLGLGLAVCKGIIEAHGGRVWVESPGYDPRQFPGSEFIIVLPLLAHVPPLSANGA